MYAKHTQTDAVSVKERSAEEEEEGGGGGEEVPGIGQRGGHKDDTIEPEKQVMCV